MGSSLQDSVGGRSPEPNRQESTSMTATTDPLRKSADLVNSPCPDCCDDNQVQLAAAEALGSALLEMSRLAAVGVTR